MDWCAPLAARCACANAAMYHALMRALALIAKGPTLLDAERGRPPFMTARGLAAALTSAAFHAGSNRVQLQEFLTPEIALTPGELADIVKVEVAHQIIAAQDLTERGH